MALLSNINSYLDCKTRLFLAGKKKYIFAHINFYLQSILDKINEQDTSFLDCKHKHMMKSGAPPDKIQSPGSMVSQAELILRVITLWFLVLTHFFRDGMGPFKHTICCFKHFRVPTLCS